jgi:hypothetical protein
MKIIFQITNYQGLQNNQFSSLGPKFRQKFEVSQNFEL